MLTFLSRAELPVHILGATNATLNFLIATLKKQKESSETIFSSIFNIFKILTFQEAIYVKQIINESNNNKAFFIIYPPLSLTYPKSLSQQKIKIH